MRSKHRAALAVFAVTFAVSAMTASSAFAAPIWHTVTPEWGQAGASLSKAVATKWKGTLKLGETGGVTVECEEAGEGSVGPGVAGTVTKETFSKCATKTGTCAQPGILAVKLPWHSEVQASESKANNVIVSGEKGTPGYAINCFSIFINECTGSPRTSMTNVSAGVEEKPIGENLKCSISGTNTGILQGTNVMEANSGGKLEKISAVKNVTSAIEVSTTGSFNLKDTGSFPIDVKCNVTTKGTIETLGVGKVTGYTLSKCEDVENCPEFETYLAEHLPWKTELYTEGTKTRERLVSGGTGTPQLTIACKRGAMLETCGLNTSQKVENVFSEGLVNVTFDTLSARTNCSQGGEKTGKWEGSSKILPSSNLEGIRAG